MSGASGSAVITGTGIGRGVAAGPVIRMSAPLPEPADAGPEQDAATAIAAVEAAAEGVAAELRARGEAADGTAREVLDALADQVADPALLDDVADRIREGRSAERAVWEAFAHFRRMLESLGGYHAERASDLADLDSRVRARLRGVASPGIPRSPEPYVLVAEDLAPADTALLDAAQVLAIVTEQGGPTSHTAIIARAKSLPAVVGAPGAAALQDGRVVVVDAANGEVRPDPGEAELARVREAIAHRATAGPRPIHPGRTADGVAVPLLANLGDPAEAPAALEAGAEGVGLYRTELAFLDRSDAPRTEELRASYAELLGAFPGRKVVVRVLDAGADKPLGFLNVAAEPNPALGVRGLRALRASEDLLRTQLDALVAAQAGTSAELWVMAPMVADVEDAEYFARIARSCGVTTVGVMVEVPSAALLADQLLECCDFLSIGTNDLTQYTLAADRQLGEVARYQDPWHPAVLRLVQTAAEAGRRAGKSVGVCGEAAADPALAAVLVGLGVTSLSMSPAAIGDVREELAAVDLAEARRRAQLALGARSAAEARRAAGE